MKHGQLAPIIKEDVPLRKVFGDQSLNGDHSLCPPSSSSPSHADHPVQLALAHKQQSSLLERSRFDGLEKVAAGDEANQLKSGKPSSAVPTQVEHLSTSPSINPSHNTGHIDYSSDVINAHSSLNPTSPTAEEDEDKTADRCFLPGRVSEDSSPTLVSDGL